MGGYSTRFVSLLSSYIHYTLAAPKCVCAPVAEACQEAQVHSAARAAASPGSHHHVAGTLAHVVCLAAEGRDAAAGGAGGRARGSGMGALFATARVG